ncbi:MAG: hypothetical protein AAFY88_29865, partial [Acidobacteriota bacterium]
MPLGNDPRSSPSMHGLRPFRLFAAALLLAPSLALPLGAAAAPETSDAAPVEVDFAAALAGLMFDPASADGNGGPGALPNGLLDAAEMALVAAVLAGEPAAAADRSAVLAAWRQALGSAEGDVEALASAFPTAATVVAGYAMVGSAESIAAIAAMTSAFGAPLEGDYRLAATLGDVFGPDGDADGDGFTNRQEYVGAIG